MIPIGNDYSLDGTEAFFIVGDTIVRKTSGWDLMLPTSHGNCSAKSVTISLNGNKDLVMSSAKVIDCEDRYRGPLRQLYPRVRQ